MYASKQLDQRWLESALNQYNSASASSRLIKVLLLKVNVIKKWLSLQRIKRKTQYSLDMIESDTDETVYSPNENVFSPNENLYSQDLFPSDETDLESANCPSSDIEQSDSENSVNSSDYDANSELSDNEVEENNYDDPSNAARDYYTMSYKEIQSLVKVSDFFCLSVCVSLSQANFPTFR